MQPSQDLVRAGTVDVAHRFGAYRRLTVRQRKRWLEILLSFEMKNTYDVYDDNQMPVLRVREEDTGAFAFVRRLLLGTLRPFRASVVDIGTDALVLQLRRPFRWFFHRLEVSLPDGTSLGAIQRRWSWLRRIYDIEDGSGRVVADIFGPILSPWTFEIRVDGQVRSVIRKRWSGLLKEALTDADNFGVSFSDQDDPEQKARALAATVLIDVVHFERAKGG